MGSPVIPVLEDQMKVNTNVKWVHSISAGIDGIVVVDSFRESKIPLTNARGAYGDVLGEFIALGVLYHTKNMERFAQRKADHKWEVERVETVFGKHMVIVGYGDIGSCCARIAKHGFGMKVSGVKRRPEQATAEQKENASEIVGNDHFDRLVKEADFIVGVLPKTAHTTDYFNKESTFSKMKPSAVFMSIGRGTTVNEEDLIEALNTKQIGGAVLDVYKKEPLVAESGLWDCPNCLMTPHCADQDVDHVKRSFSVFAEILQLYSEKGESGLINVCDKS